MVVREAIRGALGGWTFWSICDAGNCLGMGVRQGLRLLASRPLSERRATCARRTIASGGCVKRWGALGGWTSWSIVLPATSWSAPAPALASLLAVCSCQSNDSKVRPCLQPLAASMRNCMQSVPVSHRDYIWCRPGLQPLAAPSNCQHSTERSHLSADYGRPKGGSPLGTGHRACDRLLTVRQAVCIWPCTVASGRSRRFLQAICNGKNL